VCVFACVCLCVCACYVTGSVDHLFVCLWFFSGPTTDQQSSFDFFWPIDHRIGVKIGIRFVGCGLVFLGAPRVFILSCGAAWSSVAYGFKIDGGCDEHSFLLLCPFI
jgi:hypothetical protein